MADIVEKDPLHPGVLLLFVVIILLMEAELGCAYLSGAWEGKGTAIETTKIETNKLTSHRNENLTLLSKWHLDNIFPRSLFP